METRPVVDAEGRAEVAAAVASVVGLVHELARVVSGPSAIPGRNAGADCGGVQPGSDAASDPLGELSASCLAGMEVLARVEAAAAAVKVRLLAAYVEAEACIEGPAASAYEASARERSLVAEVACVLTVGERAASALLGEAHALTSSLPAALDALEAGTISWQHARVLSDETSGLDQAQVAALEAHFFDPDVPDPARGAAPGELVPSRFRRKVRAWRERTFPESLEVRHALAVADRRMEYRPVEDGMAWISLKLPGDEACAVWNKSTAIARGLQGPGEQRTLSQRRVDVAARLLLGLTGPDLQKRSSLKADVLVTVPVLSVVGATDEPAMLDGYGPVPASMARKLVGEGAGTLYRVLVDPRDGAPLEIGRKSYRLPESVKRWLRMRDGKCTFPGCSNSTADNENDHLTAWENGGATGVSNLGQVCPKHHKLKHSSGWTPTPATKDEPPGWISPTGHYYPAEQPDWVPPVIPQFLSSGTPSSGSSGSPPVELAVIPAAQPDAPLAVPQSDLPAAQPDAPLAVPQSDLPAAQPDAPLAVPQSDLPAAQPDAPLAVPVPAQPDVPLADPQVVPAPAQPDVPLAGPPPGPPGEQSPFERVLTEFLAA